MTEQSGRKFPAFDWREGRGDDDMGEAFVDERSLIEKLIGEIEFAGDEQEIRRLLDGNVSALTDDEYLEAVEAGRIRADQLGRAARNKQVAGGD